MNLYSFYLKERENLDVLEREGGFAVYQVIDDSIYIKDIYVVPSQRNKSLATMMADDIAEIGRNQGCKQMLGSISPLDPEATRNMKVLLAYGFKLFKVTESLILFSKEIL